MTFILNVLHKDYSLMLADTLGNAHGPLTMSAGKLTISVPSGGVVEGMRKTHLSNNKQMAVGYAGTTGAHGYIESFMSASNPEVAMQYVREHIESQLNFSDLDDFLAGKGAMENSLILSFFDQERGAFFSNLHLFTPTSSGNSLHARKNNPSPILLHVGSGSSHFERAVGLDAINSFISDIEGGLSIEEQLCWIDEAYEKVSLVAPGCGAKYEAAIATRNEPDFRFIRQVDGMTIKPHSSV